MNKYILTAFFFLIILLFESCDSFEYSVYQTSGYEMIEEATTVYNINRLFNLPRKDTLHLVLTGDTQRFYDDVEDLVKVTNALPKVDAVIITGDLADYGIGRQYVWLNRELKKLKVPFLTVIGNHDCLANGIKLYENVYGPLDYSFTWNDIRFIMHNTNGREFAFNGNVPDLNWMKQQLADTSAYQCCVFVSHIPPFNSDFDKSLEMDYVKLIDEAKNTVFSANGHRHVYGLNQYMGGNTWHINTSSPSNRIYCYITIYPYATGKKFDCVPVSFSNTVVAQNDSGTVVKLNQWYKPNGVGMQYAGGFGLISMGVLFKPLKHTEVDFTAGYVPPSYGNIWTINLFISYDFLRIKLTDRFSFHPLKVGAFANFNAGKNIYLIWPSKYPDEDYYWWNSSFRFGPFVNAELAYTPLQSKYAYSFYLQCNSNDYYISSYYSNYNSLQLKDLLVFGAGIKVNRR